MSTNVTTGAAPADEPKSFFRRDHLVGIEKKVQAEWLEQGVFEADALPAGKNLY
jgi:hypothetical protein